MAMTDLSIIRRNMWSRRVPALVAMCMLAVAVAILLLSLAPIASEGEPATDASGAGIPNLAWVAGAFMLCGGCAIAIAMGRSMTQRRRQIAVLRLLGWSRVRVAALVLTEAAMTGLLGSIGGVGLRMAAWVLLAAQPGPGLATMLIVMLATVVLATLAGLAPAMMAYRAPIVPNLESAE